MSCFTSALILTLASCIRWTTCSIVTVSRGSTVARVLSMAVATFVIAVLTSIKLNSLSILFEGGLVPSKLQG